MVFRRLSVPNWPQIGYIQQRVIACSNVLRTTEMKSIRRESVNNEIYEIKWK